MLNPLVQMLPLSNAGRLLPLIVCTDTADYSGTWKMLKASTPVKVRWMGDAVPGLLVNSSRHRPSSCGDVVGAWVRACERFNVLHWTVVRQRVQQFGQPMFGSKHAGCCLQRTCCITHACILKIG